MSDSYIQYSFFVEMTDEEQDWVLEQIKDNHEAYKAPDIEAFGEVEKETLYGEKGLWFHGDNGFEDCLAELLQTFIERFEPNYSIKVSWAETCSSPRVDELGGGAAFITADSIKYMTSHEWLKNQQQKHSDGEPKSINDLWTLTKGYTCVKHAVGNYFGGDAIPVKKIIDEMSKYPDHSIYSLDIADPDSDNPVYVVDEYEHSLCKDLLERIEAEALVLYHTFVLHN